MSMAELLLFPWHPNLSEGPTEEQHPLPVGTVSYELGLSWGHREQTAFRELWPLISLELRQQDLKIVTRNTGLVSPASVIATG